MLNPLAVPKSAYSTAGDFKDTRSDGVTRAVLFSDHALERFRERLPQHHVFQRLDDQTLADRIERAVIDLSRLSPPPVVNDPQGEGYQWELDLGPRISFPLIAVMKDRGSWGNPLPPGQKILVTFLVGASLGGKTTNRRLGYVGGRR